MQAAKRIYKIKNEKENKKMAELRIGLVGTGGIGRTHIERVKVQASVLQSQPAQIRPAILV